MPESTAPPVTSLPVRSLVASLLLLLLAGLAAASQIDAMAATEGGCDMNRARVCLPLSLRQASAAQLARPAQC